MIPVPIWKVRIVLRGSCHEILELLSRYAHLLKKIADVVFELLGRIQWLLKFLERLLSRHLTRKRIGICFFALRDFPSR